MLLPSNDLFNYTSGRWLVNEPLRLGERRREFDVQELSRLAAESIGRNSGDIDTFVKLAEGARIPYPVTVPDCYAVASEVATMRFLRSRGIPIPEVYGYSPTSDNSAQTEYIFMEFVKGTPLADVWQHLGEVDMASVLRQAVQLESQMMSISFPAGGSLYYSEDLEKVAAPVIPLEDSRFSVGPDARLHMWYGRRSQLNINRGPYKSAEETLEAVARKEMAFLERFGEPRMPFQRERREFYEFKAQSPSDHMEHLERYLVMAPYFVPKDASLREFRIRHPDLQPGNVILSRSPDSDQLQIVSLLDWQHAAILPAFLSAGIPRQMQNYDDPASQAAIPPSQLLPTNMEGLNEAEQSQAIELYRRRLVHYYYVKNTLEHNRPHFDVLSNYDFMFICRLFFEAGSPWEGESYALKASLIEATERWAKVAGGEPCPVVFDAEDVQKTKELGKQLQEMEENIEGLKGVIGFASETWVPADHYEFAAAMAQQLKQTVLENLPEEEVPDVAANWFLDDMDEGGYM